MITVKNLIKTYKSRKAGSVVAINGVSFALPERGMVFFLGKSGCGKSTLLNLLGGLDGFDGGDITVGGRSMKSFTARDYDDYRNGSVGFVFQENNLLEEYTVARNIGLALELQKQNDYAEKVNSVLEAVDLKDFAERKANSLSGGQKQRVAIARALVKEPQILLCDEPTGALDSATGEEIFSLLKQISEKSLVVVVSHDRESAEKFGDRIIELKDGKIISDSSPLNGGEVSVSKDLKINEGKSGFPAKRVFGMGLGFLVSKPVRLCLCAIICLFAFTCLGISGAVSSYDKHVAFMETMKLYSTPYIAYERWEYSFSENTTNTAYHQYITPSFYNQVKDKIKGNRLDKVYNYFRLTCDSIAIPDGTFVGGAYIVHNDPTYKFRGFTEIDDRLAEDYGYTLYGKLPSSYEEVVLTKHLFNGFKKYGYRERVSKPKQDINGYDDLIGKEIYLDGTTFKVTGILDTKVNVEYDKYLYDEEYCSGDITAKLWGLFEYGMHNIIYLAPGYYENVIAANGADDRTDVVCCPFKGDSASLSNLRIENIKFAIGNGDGYSQYRVLNDATRVIEGADEKMSFLKLSFFWISVGASVLSALFVLYYASGVVSEKKRDLGVLRALGASRADVVKIFLTENGIFTAAIILLSTIFSVVGVSIVNASLIAKFAIEAVLISYSVSQFLIPAAIAICAVGAGIILPLIKLLRAKPVDVIAGRK